MKYKLVVAGVTAPPGCLIARASDKEAFKKSYPTVAHVTNVLKEELLARLQERMFPKEESFTLPGWESRQAKNVGYIKALKEVIELLP